MRERGIIFNDEMVRAVLEGSKTQTRRIIKGCPTVQDGWYPDRYNNSEEWTFWGPRGSADAGRCTLPFVKCPFGAVGDRLWVRETWQAIYDYTDEHGNVEERRYAQSIPKQKSYWHPVYAAARGNEDRETRGFPWCPSIHMPRWASRITLEITGVRVERLNNISEEDAQSEGVQQLRGGFWRHYQPGWTQHQLSARGSFLTLWDSIYGEESWQANPWVWVIEFKRVKGGSDD